MSDDRLTRIEDKVDKLDNHLSSIDTTLALQHQSLEIHIKRTDLLESAIHPLIRRHTMVDGVVKFLGLIGVILTIYESLRHMK